MCGGGLTPKKLSAVGARSMIAGSSFSIGWLARKMPGTSLGSTMWSPLQALTLSSKTAPATTPEVPGVFSQGETLAELEDNIRDAYDLVLSDAAPAPSPAGAESKPIEVDV